MLTWRLWRALRYPDEGNPLFERVQAQRVDLPGKRLLRTLAPLYPAFSFVVTAVMIVIAPVMVWLIANALGALLAYNLMSTINREREQHTYDLLALTPIGLGNANWQIAAASAHRLNAVERLAQMRTLALTPLVLLIFFSFRGTTFSPFTVVIVMIALNLDAIQTLIVGCLSGMLAQTFSEQGAPFAAVALFAFAQIIVVYLPVTSAAILLIDLLPAMLPEALRERWIVELIAGGVTLGLLLVLREAVIRLMWRALERRLL